MTRPYIPQPGGPGAYEQQLAARCRRLEQDRTTLETELGQARKRNAELQQRAETAEAALAALHEGEELYEDERTAPTPAQWIWWWNQAALADRLRRAEQATADAEHVLQCRFARWEERAREAEAQVRELQGRLDDAEARIAELQQDEGDWLTGVLYARKLSVCWDEPLVSPAFTGDKPQPAGPEPVTLTARYMTHQAPACPSCEWAAHPPLTCDEVAAFRDRFDSLLTEKLREIHTEGRP